MRLKLRSSMSPCVCPRGRGLVDVYSSSRAMLAGHRCFSPTREPKRAAAPAMRPLSRFLCSRAGEGEADVDAGARVALNDQQLVAGVRDQAEPDAEARAVIAGKHP